MVNIASTSPASKALWYIESHFQEEINLEKIAAIVGVSPFHLTRVFAVNTGYSVMRYARARRLSEAARLLANGAPDILAVALEAGYNSHEAFTRAFGDQFGLTPESLRAQGHINTIKLVEAIKMDETLLAQYYPPRLLDGKTMLVAGIGERYTAETSAAIPAQWQKLTPYMGSIAGQVGRATYGVLCNGDGAGNTEYICGVEVSDFSRVPAEFSRIKIPAHRYAVFTHRGHISAIRRTWYTIFNQWLPDSGYTLADGPEFERYDERFDPMSGNGELEIWIPLQQ